MRVPGNCFAYGDEYLDFGNPANRPDPPADYTECHFCDRHSENSFLNINIFTTSGDIDVCDECLKYEIQPCDRCGLDTIIEKGIDDEGDFYCPECWVEKTLDIVN